MPKTVVSFIPYAKYPSLFDTPDARCLFDTPFQIAKL